MSEQKELINKTKRKEIKLGKAYIVLGWVIKVLSVLIGALIIFGSLYACLAIYIVNHRLPSDIGIYILKIIIAFVVFGGIFALGDWLVAKGKTKSKG